MDFDQLVEAVAAAERFQNDPTGVNEDSREQQDSTAAQILLGREELPEVSISDDQVRTVNFLFTAEKVVQQSKNL